MSHRRAPTAASAQRAALEERQHAVEEEPAGVGVQVELVLVAERRLVVGGEEQRLGLQSLGPEPLDQELGVRSERIDVADGDEGRREPRAQVVGHGACGEHGVLEEAAAPEYAQSTVFRKRQPAGVSASRANSRRRVRRRGPGRAAASA